MRASTELKVLHAADEFDQILHGNLVHVYMQVADVQDGAAVDPQSLSRVEGPETCLQLAQDIGVRGVPAEIGSIPFGAQALTDADQLP